MGKQYCSACDIHIHERDAKQHTGGKKHLSKEIEALKEANFDALSLSETLNCFSPDHMVPIDFSPDALTDERKKEQRHVLLYYTYNTVVDIGVTMLSAWQTSMCQKLHLNGRIRVAREV